MITAFGGFDANTQLSARFKLGDLIRTDTGKYNLPDSTAFGYLQKLAQALELLYDRVGPFRIESAFRSQATQDALIASGNNQAVATSFHTKGTAADIQPTTMSVDQYVAKIAQMPEIARSLGDIAKKNTVIHVTLPEYDRIGLFKYVDAAGNYIRLTASQVQDLVKRYPIAAAATGGLGFVLLGALGYLLYLKKKNR